MAVMSTPELGARVRELRLRRKLSQAALAGNADVAADTIRRLEKGLFSPSFNTILKVAKALGITPIELLDDERDQADELAVVIRNLPEVHKQVAYAVLGALHVQAAVQ